MITNLYFKNKLSYVWDADFLAFWARTSGTPDSWMTAYNQLFIDLKIAGILQKADVLYIFAGHNESDARLNLIKNAHTATAHNSPTFIAKEGFKGIGVTSYIDSHYTPSTDGENYKLGDASFGIILFSNSGNTNCLTGVYDGAVFDEIFITGGYCYCLINDADANISFSYANTVGVHGVSRIGTTKIANINGALYSATSSAISLPSASEYVLGRNVFGPSDLSQAGISAKWSSAYLSHNEMNILNNIVNEFKTRIAAL